MVESDQLEKAIRAAGYLAESLFVRAVVSRDHLGRMQADKYFLKAVLYPKAEVNPEELGRVRDVLHECGLIILYQVNGMIFLQFPKVGKWSRLEGNMKASSECPEPPAEAIRAWEDKFSDKFHPSRRRTNAVRTAYERGSDTVRPEGEGEGEGEREGEREKKGAAAPPPPGTKSKRRFLEYVHLTEDEYQRLVDRIGERLTKSYIERLNNYIGSKGKRYKSHYHTILNWIGRDSGDNGHGAKAKTPGGETAQDGLEGAQTLTPTQRRNFERIRRFNEREATHEMGQTAAEASTA